MCSDTLTHDLPWHSADSLTPYDWWRKSVSIIYVIIQKKKKSVSTCQVLALEQETQ